MFFHIGTAQPAMVACKMQAQSEHVHVACMFLLVWCPLALYSVGVLINKISASELRRKFIKSALLVGCSLLVDVVGWV